MNWTLFLAMIAALETGGHPDHDNAIGDGGRAIGRYQIHESFVDDANRLCHLVNIYNHEDAKIEIYASEIMKDWHRHYAGKYGDLGDYVSMARRHNGGPHGHLKDSTEEYGSRAQAWLDEHAKEYEIIEKTGAM